MATHDRTAGSDPSDEIINNVFADHSINLTDDKPGFIFSV